MFCKRFVQAQLVTSASEAYIGICFNPSIIGLLDPGRKGVSTAAWVIILLAAVVAVVVAYFCTTAYRRRSLPSSLQSPGNTQLADRWQSHPEAVAVSLSLLFKSVVN